jgi:hypothetical protein
MGGGARPPPCADLGSPANVLAQTRQELSVFGVSVAGAIGIARAIAALGGHAYLEAQHL